MFLTSVLETNIKHKTFFNEIIYYPSTKSTNSDIWNLYKKFPEKYLIITDNQIAGRGRGLNSWLSTTNKSITCSFILDQIYSLELFNFHSLIIPLSIIKGIKKYLSIDLQIKWPNDIMYKNFKVGGVLIETKQYSKKYVFNIGIGINVNEDMNDFNNTLKNKAISLKMITGNSIQRELLLGYIINELYNIINNDNLNKIKSDWLKSCNHINRDIIFMYKQKSIKGLFQTINDYGQAMIKYNQKLITYEGEIKFS
tara:strand:+ start:696 stop:1457 length:762 start_codon:yes stop_codon:yes gene_type:complete